MSELKGFMGTILEIDLTSKKIEKIPLNWNWAKKFLGGAGYATAYLYNLLDKDTDPLGPENILFYGVIRWRSLRLRRSRTRRRPNFEAKARSER